MLVRLLVVLILLAAAGVRVHALDPGSVTAAVQWDAVSRLVREERLSKKHAIDAFKNIRPRLDAYFKEHGGAGVPRKKWVFPVEGRGAKDIEKYYVARGFDFFVKSERNFHPAFDIFIRDRNRDDRDDRTGEFVRILSMSAGVVVSANTGWEPGNPLRGGNFVYVYDPVSKGAFYYAHLRDVAVSVGDIVKPGDLLGTMGRTGKNAYKKRSPTHLHIMYVRYPENGYLVPQKIYEDLLKAAQRGKTKKAI